VQVYSRQGNVRSLPRLSKGKNKLFEAVKILIGKVLQYEIVKNFRGHMVGRRQKRPIEVVQRGMKGG
jgi:hypothetical protein